MSKRWQNLGIAVLAVVTGVAVIGAVRASSGDNPTPAERAAAQSQVSALAVPSSAAPVVRAVFFGDSYVGGSDMGGKDAAGWPSLVSHRFGWHPVLDAFGGTGYVQSHDGNPPYAQRVTQVVADAPDFLFVEGSRNDLGNPAVDTGIDSTLTGLRAGLPNAKIVVVAPPWVDCHPPAELLAIRDHEKTVAAQIRAAFIDPLTEGWFCQHPELIGADHVHPTDAGHALMAQRIEADLTADGLTG